MIKATTIRRYPAGILAGIILVSFFVSTISILLPTKVAAYQYVDTSITTEKDCTATAGTWNHLAQGGSVTGSYYDYCLVNSSPDQDANLLLQAGWLASCMAAVISPTNPADFSAQDIQNYSLNSSATKIIGHIIAKDDGKLNCGQSGNIQAKVQNLGYTDFLQFLVALGCKPTDKGGYRCNSNDSGSVLGSEASILQRIVSYQSYRYQGADSYKLSDADRYYISLETFKIGCQATRIDNPTSSDVNVADTKSGPTYHITEISSTGVKTDAIYKTAKGRGDDISTLPPSLGWNDGSFTCDTLANMTLGSYADRYAVWVRAHPLQAGNIKAADNAAAGPQQSSCAVDGIGWIVCPVMTFLGKVSDLAYGFISDTYLKINVGLLNPTLPSGDVNPTYSTWGTFRNIANVLFVIAFLIIVFSQLTSFGVGNYGVKKMLPRLIVAAVLVNTSYFIVQIAVDISNILGYSLKAMFDNLPVYSNASTNNFEIIGQALTWTVIIGGVLAGSIAIGLAISVPVLLAALAAVLITVIILIARQAIIVLLVIISPIAFVAWLLPNTEQWFKKWWKMFSGLLMVFPVIGVLFGASKLAATVIQAVGAGTDNTMMQILAMGVATIPLVMVPSLLKGSLNAAGSIGTKLSSLSTKANSKVGGRVKNDSRLGEAMKNRQFNNIRRRAEKRSRTGGWQDQLDRSLVGRRLGFDRGARMASQISDKAFEEEISAADGVQKKYTSDELSSAANTGIVNGKAISNAERTAAVRQIMRVGTSDQRRTLYSASSNASEEVRQSIRDGFFAAGDQKFYGAGVGDLIHDGKISNVGQLDDAIANRIKGEGFSAETMVSDSLLAAHIARIGSNGGTPNSPLDPESIARLANVATTAIKGDATKQKITSNMLGPITSISNLAGAPAPTTEGSGNADSGSQNSTD